MSVSCGVQGFMGMYTCHGSCCSSSLGSLSLLGHVPPDSNAVQRVAARFDHPAHGEVLLCSTWLCSIDFKDSFHLLLAMLLLLLLLAQVQLLPLLLAPQLLLHPCLVLRLGLTHCQEVPLSFQGLQHVQLLCQPLQFLKPLLVLEQQILVLLASHMRQGPLDISILVVQHVLIAQEILMTWTQ